MRRPTDPAEADRARARLAASFIPCHSCGSQQAGPLHRKSKRLWQMRVDRARAQGTDPDSGVSLAEAERHLAAIVSQRVTGPRSLVFASGSMPGECASGHQWEQPHSYLLGWRPCDCPAALAANKGHHVVRCTPPDGKCSEEWRDPPCSSRGT